MSRSRGSEPGEGDHGVVIRTAYWRHPGPASHRLSVGRETYSVGVGDSALVFECDYEFSRVIVWDALVDPDLVSGWLAEAAITAEVGGEYNLRWVHRMGRPDTFGRITDMQPLERLVVDTSDSVLVTFELLELPGGLRARARAYT